MQDLIQEVNIPEETVVERTDNGEKEVKRKIFPGYVLVKMIMTDESWHLVRNSRGCTGFVGAEGKPVPLTEQEILALGVEWGVSTRIIGGIIMTHGDNNGLVLPPNIAPIQVIVLPIAAHKPGVTEKAQELVDRLKAAGIRVKGDFSDNSPGWKFANWEMKGVPLRIEIGPKDMENGQCVAVRRDNREKTFLSLDELEARIPGLLADVQTGLFEKAKANLDSHIFPAFSLEEARRLQEEKGGFIKTMWFIMFP